MFKKILVAMDVSPFGEQVFEAALAIAHKDTEGKLLLLHVLSPEEENSPLPIPENLRDIYPAQGNDFTLSQWRQEWEDFAAGGINMLQNYQKRAQATGVSTDYEQVYGSPAKTICKIAQKEGINLIVIGRRGRSGVSEMLLGSVSNYVLHHAPCAVLIVQGRS
jgi:nucleotide-binding universal stress UspA family protein